MFSKNSPVGVMDSGVGGMSVAKEIRRLLPGESLVYFGDNVNVPYGNKSQEEILRLTNAMLDRLAAEGVKAVVIACNTISTLVEILAPKRDFKLIGIIAPTARDVARRSLPAVGLIATEFTVAKGSYQSLIAAENPNVKVSAKGSPLLAGLVDRGDFDEKAIDAEVREQMDVILREPAVEEVILGCTHYPLIRERFEACYPTLRFIDPGLNQALELQRYLAENDLLSEATAPASFSVCTTGQPVVYESIAKKLGITLSSITRVDI